MISVLTVSVLMIRVLMISAVLRCNIGATGALRAAPGQGPGPCRQERERWSCALRLLTDLRYPRALRASGFH